MNFINLVSQSTSMTGMNELGGFLTIIAGFIIGFLILGLAFYVYMSLTMMFTAKKLNTEYAWLAWIPVFNIILMAKMAKMHWWPILLMLTMFLSVINHIVIQVITGLAMLILLVYTFIWTWKICEFRGRPGWWAILLIIPIIGQIWGLIMWGILAWGE